MRKNGCKIEKCFGWIWVGGMVLAAKWHEPKKSLLKKKASSNEAIRFYGFAYRATFDVGILDRDVYIIQVVFRTAHRRGDVGGLRFIISLKCLTFRLIFVHRNFSSPPVLFFFFGKWCRHDIVVCACSRHPHTTKWATVLYFTNIT